MLSIRIDLGKGQYIISRNNGAEIITKSINENGSNYYDKATMEARRQELPKLMGVRWVPSEILAEVDTVLFDALQEFDAKYGTNYTKPYFDAVIEQVPFTDVSEKNKQRLERARKLKAERLEKAGISIQYDVNVLGNAKGLKMSDVIRGFIVALKSKRNGANVKINTVYRPSKTDESTIKVLGEDDIPDMPEDFEPIEEPTFSASQKSLETPEEIVKDDLGNQARDNFEDIDEETRQHIADEVSKIMAEKTKDGDVGAGTGTGIDLEDEQENLAERLTGQNNPKQETAKIDSQEQHTNPITTTVLEAEPIPEPQLVSEEQPAPEGQAVDSKKEGKPKATSQRVSRSKTIQASKKASREAAKLKNTYQSRIAAKAERKAKAEAARVEKAKAEAEEAKKAEEARIAREAEEARKAKEAEERAEQERIRAEEEARAAEEEARIAAEVQKTMDEIMGRVGVRIGRKPKTENPEKEKWSHRFTRKLKSTADSIRNKVYEHKETAKKIVIAAAVGAVCISAAIGIGLHNRNNQAEVVTPPPSYSSSASVGDNTHSVPPSSDTSIDQDTSNGGSTTIENEVPGEKTDVGSGTVIDGENHGSASERPGGTIDEKPSDMGETGSEEEKDDMNDFLSSVKVGATINVENGRYYEAPDGTGRSGSFESFKDATKRIEIIDVQTNEGVIVIRDGNISLAELKQQYPNAKFSYHIVAELPDGTTRTLGWMTHNSFEQTIDQNVHQVEDDGR